MINKLKQKNITHHDLVDLVQAYAADVPKGGVCNGVTSMWIQAVLDGQKSEDTFYRRFDILSKYLSKPKHTISSLKTKIDRIYKSQSLEALKKGEGRKPLTAEQLDIMELRSFAGLVAIQHAPDKLGIFSKFIPQTAKNQLFPLTASAALDRSTDICFLENPNDLESIKEFGEKIYITLQGNQLKYTLLNLKNERVEGFINLSEDSLKQLAENGFKKPPLHLKSEILEELAEQGHIRKIKAHIMGTVGFSQTALVNYLRLMKTQLIQHDKDNPERSVFLLGSGRHAVGMYWDFPSNKWHFFNINELTGKINYYVKTSSSKQLASIIFDSFHDNQKNGNTTFTIRHLSATPKATLVDSLQTVTRSVVNPNAKGNAKGMTPFILAVTQRDIETVKNLLKQNANLINTKDMEGLTALMIASQKEDIEMVNLLLATPGININEKDNEGLTALMLVAQKSDLEMVNALLNPESIQAIDNKNRTVLMIAASLSNSKTVEVLLPGSDVNAISKEGLTALMYAAIRTDADAIEVVKILLSTPGIDLHAKTSTGLTALHCAQSNPAIANLIREAIRLEASRAEAEAARAHLSTHERRLSFTGPVLTHTHSEKTLKDIPTPSLPSNKKPSQV